MGFLQDFYVNITEKEEKNWVHSDMKSNTSLLWKRSAKTFCVIIH